MAKVLFRNTLTSEEEGSIQGNGRALRPVFATEAVIGGILEDGGLGLAEQYLGTGHCAPILAG
jgi:hypothetical protein